MDLSHTLKAKYLHEIERKYATIIQGKQFNITCSRDIIVGVKLMEAGLQLPYYVIAEHLFQVGTCHIPRATKDPQKREKLVEHSVKVHLLGDELTDDKDMLRLGEKN